MSTSFINRHKPLYNSVIEYNGFMEEKIKPVLFLFAGCHIFIHTFMEESVQHNHYYIGISLHMHK